MMTQREALLAHMGNNFGFSYEAQGSISYFIRQYQQDLEQYEELRDNDEITDVEYLNARASSAESLANHLAHYASVMRREANDHARCSQQLAEITSN